MNKKAFLEIDEPATFVALALGLVGGFIGFWYSGYLGTGAGVITRILTGLFAAVASFFVAYFIFNK